MNLKVLQENKDMIIVYLNPETSVSCPKKSVSVGDVTEVYCKKKSIRKKIQSLPLMRMDDTDHKKYVISTMTLIACIDARDPGKYGDPKYGRQPICCMRNGKKA